MTRPASFIRSFGMLTAVGGDAPSSCAAIRARIAGFEETLFSFDDAPMLGASVHLNGEPRDGERLSTLLSFAVAECARDMAMELPATLLVALPESARPGRPQPLDEFLIREVSRSTGLPFASDSCVFPGGRVAGVDAVAHAVELLARGTQACIVAGVDSQLTRATLDALHQQGRLLTDRNSDGLIPGEGAAAVLMVRSAVPGDLGVAGIGRGNEPAYVGSGLPLRGDGLVRACEQALAAAGRSLSDVDYRIADLSGPQHGFKEAALMVTRLLRANKDRFDLWLPSAFVGEMGAATVPLAMGIAAMAVRKNYAPGPVALVHVSNDGPERAAILLEAA